MDDIHKRESSAYLIYVVRVLSLIAGTKRHLELLGLHYEVQAFLTLTVYFEMMRYLPVFMFERELFRCLLLIIHH